MLHFYPIFWINTITDRSTLNTALNQSHRLERFKVLRNGGLGQSNFQHQIATNTLIGFKKML